jgi:hypothetical protein
MVSASHHRGVGEGEVTALATLVHGGRTLASYDIAVTDAVGHRVCTSWLTCLVRDQMHGLDGAMLIIWRMVSDLEVISRSPGG